MNDSHTAAHDSGVSPSPKHRHWQRRTLEACFVSALVLSTVGYRAYQPETSVLNALYHSAQLFALQAPHFERPVPLTLKLGRWLAAATTVFAALQVVQRMWREEWHAHRLGRLRGHVLVCGLGRKGMGLVRCLRRREAGFLKREVVVIDKTPAPDFATECELLGRACPDRRCHAGGDPAGSAH